MRLFCTSASPLLLGKQICQYHPSRFYVYALICDIRFSFSDYFTLIIGSRVPGAEWLVGEEEGWGDEGEDDEWRE